MFLHMGVRWLVAEVVRLPATQAISQQVKELYGKGEKYDPQMIQ